MKIENEIKETIEAIPGVNKVVISKVLNVTIYLDKNDQNLRNFIYDTEWALMQKFPHQIIDWHIVLIEEEDELE